MLWWAIQVGAEIVAEELIQHSWKTGITDIEECALDCWWPTGDLNAKKKQASAKVIPANKIQKVKRAADRGRG